MVDVDEPRPCRRCGKMVSGRNTKGTLRQFCSIACYRAPSRTQSCEGCGSVFEYRRNSANRYCSRECAFKHGTWKPTGHQIESEVKALARIKTNILGWATKIYVVTGKPLKFSVRPTRQQERWAACVRVRVPVVDLRCSVCGDAFSCTLGYRRDKCLRCSKAQTNRNSKHIRRSRQRTNGGHRVDDVAIFDRDGWKCQGCHMSVYKWWGAKHHDLVATIDHRAPLSKGGMHHESNLQCMCHRCNTIKRSMIDPRLIFEYPPG
jgi:hypothetical protein